MLGEPGVALRFRGVEAGGESSSLRPRSSRAGSRLCLQRRHFVHFQSLTFPVEQIQDDKDDSLENRRKTNVEFVQRLNAFARGSKVLQKGGEGCEK